MPTYLSRTLIWAILILLPAGVYAQITANFSASPTSSCGPVVIYFTDLSTGGPTAWEWDFGDGSGKSYAQSPSHSYSAITTGKTYTVTLKASKGSTSDVETKTAYITIHESPQVDFTGTPLAGCAPLNVAFTNTSIAGGNGTNSYYWYFGSAGNASTANPTYSFTASGAYNITLNVTNSWGCLGTKTKNGYVNVIGKPVVSFGATATSFCSSPAMVTFTNASTGAGSLSYKWYFGDGNTSGAATPTNSYTGIPKCWSPKLVVTDGNGCVDSLTRTDLICTNDPQVSSAMPTSLCIGIQGSFSAAGTPAGGSYIWEWGDGSPNSSGPAPGHTFYTSGPKTVKVTYSYAGCTNTSTKTVTINPKPVGTFKISPDTLCPAAVTVQFIPSGTFSSYLWDFGDGSTKSTQASPFHTYTTNGFFSPSLIISSTEGCFDTIRRDQYVKIYDLYIDASAPDTEGCKPLLVEFKSKVYTSTPSPKSPYPYPVATYSWDFGDGNTGTGAQPNHTYTVSGTYKAVLTVTTKGGCITTDTVTINVGTKPVANFSESDIHICSGETIKFTDLSTDTVTGWHWFFGPPKAESTEQHPRYRYRSPGVWTVKLIANYNTCEDDTVKVLRIIVDSPGIGYQALYSCDTAKKVNFLNGTIGATSYYWIFGDGGTDTAKDVSHIYANYGTYTSTLIVRNSRSGCSDTMSIPIQLMESTMGLTANDTAICTGDIVKFTASKTGLPAWASWWYVDNRYVGDSLMGISVRFFDKGFHKVAVVLTDSHGCRDSVVKDPFIFVSRPSVADTGTPLTGCAPLTVNFTDLSVVPTGATIAGRLWDFGNGSAPSTGPTISRIYNRGSYDLKLYVTDNVGCLDSLIKPLYVTAYKPLANFTVKDSACIGQQVGFANTSSVQSSVSFPQWDFGDGATSTVYSPSHAYSTIGSFDVRLIITDGFGCKDTITKKPAVTTIKPTASFTMSDSVAVCPPLLVQFTNTSTNSVRPYFWDLGDGGTTALINPKNLYTGSGLYTIMMVAKNSLGCTDTTYGHVSILGYAGAFSYAPLEGCNPLTVTFTSTSTNVATMIWDFSDGYTTSNVTTSVTHTYTHPGTYIPRLLYGDSKGCKAMSIGIDEIHVDDVEADFVGDAPCQFSTVTLIDTSKTYFSPKTVWKWTFADGTTGNKNTAKHYFGAPGKYPIKLYVENAWGCIDSVTKDLEIFGLPNISAGVDTVVCLVDSAQLHATGGVSYKWNYATSLSCLDCPDPFAFPKTDAFYIVTGTDEHNCKNSDTVNVKVKYKVTAITSPDQEICNRDKVTLTATGGNTYLWMPPDGLDDPRSSSPNASPNTTTKYMVVSYIGRCIPDTDLVKVTVFPLPTVKATGSTTIVAGNSTVIQATGNLIDKFKWTPSEDLSCADCPDPTASPLKTTEYKIEVFSDHGCVDSDKVRIEVLCDKSQLFIPNSFTPNGDGMNDIFYPRGTGLENIKSFRIYNRWGEMVYEKTSLTINDKAAGWDGTFNGNELPPDVFVYMIEAICTDGKKILFKGDITLIR